jgi:hypothetical protein
MIVKQIQLFICKKASVCEDTTCPHRKGHEEFRDCKEEICSRYNHIEQHNVGCIHYTEDWDI